MKDACFRFRAPHGLGAFALALASWLVATVAWAATVPAAPPPKATPPMQFTLVHGDHPSCNPHCPRWISAEGKIEIGTAYRFARFVAGLGGARPPILISSPGGSVADAMAMGRLIRAKGLSVAVAHTTITPCDAPKGCEATGVTAARAGYCASACGLVLAGGVERYVIPYGLVGVHQITMIVTRTSVLRTYRVHYRVVNGRREEISRDLTAEKRSTTTSKQGVTPKLESDVSIYFKEMGVGGPIMDLMESTPAASLHWLTAEELKTTGLATIWIDTPSAIDNGDANGISGAPVDPTSDHIAMLHALDLTALPPPTRGPAATLESDFAYRRGGGQVAAVFRMIRVDVKPDEPATAPGFELQLSSGDGVAPTFRAGFGERLPVRIPIASFCKIGREVRLSIVRLEGAGPPLALDAKNVPGLKKLMDEACVPVLVKKTGKA